MTDKEKLKQEIADFQNINNTVEEVAEDFGEIFDIVSDRRNTKLIELIFNNFVSIFYENTNTYKFLNDKFGKVEEQFLSSLDLKQKQLYEQIDIIHNEMSNDYCIQAFTLGLLMSNRLKEELDNCCNNNEMANNLIAYIKQLKWYQK